MEQHENAQLKQHLIETQEAHKVAQNSIMRQETTLAENQRQLSVAESTLLNSQVRIETLMAEQTALREEAEHVRNNVYAHTEAEHEELRRHSVVREDEIRKAERQAAEEVARSSELRSRSHQLAIELGHAQAALADAARRDADRQREVLERAGF